MTPAMQKALQSAVRTGSPTDHLRGAGEWGGWARTRASLMVRGWIGRDEKITATGRAAYVAVTAGDRVMVAEEQTEAKP